MKFGEQLKQAMYPPFAEGYVNYESLKHMIRMEQVGFGETLRAEVERVASYGSRLKRKIWAKLEATERRWNDVMTWRKSGFRDLATHMQEIATEFEQLVDEVRHLLDFVTINTTGIQKLCKKHDRRSGEVSGPMLLSKLQRDAKSAYLNELTSTKDLELLVNRVQHGLELVQEAQREDGVPKVLTHPLGPDHIFLSRSQSLPSATSSSSASSPGPPSFLFENPSNSFENIAKTLLARAETSTEMGEQIGIALTGSFLAGVSFGGFWTICEVLLDPWSTSVAVLVATFGSITGSLPALASFYYSSFAFTGALGWWLFSSTSGSYARHVYIDLFCCWLLGVFIGCWTVQLPRRLVSSSSTSIYTRLTIVVSPLLGACSAAACLVLLSIPEKEFARVVAVGCGLLYLWSLIANNNSDVNPELETRFDSEIDSLEEGERAPTPSHGKYSTMNSSTSSKQGVNQRTWKEASSHVLSLGVLGRLAIGRTVRTLVILEVVSFFPALWSEDFFLLSIGSIVALFIGAVVPPWCCSLVGCISLYILGGPGLVVWVWVEASSRGDMLNFEPKMAPRADMMLYVADAFAVALFAVELSYMDLPQERPVALSYLSGLLLLVSSVGRLVFATL